MLSLMATRRPASGPSAACVRSDVTYQAPSSLPPSAGHCQSLAGGSVSRALYSRSTTPYEVIAPAISSRYHSTSWESSPSPYRSAIAASSSPDGGVKVTAASLQPVRHFLYQLPQSCRNLYECPLAGPGLPDGP